MCTVREWDLSYECLESRKARQALRELKETDPEFYNELTAGKNSSLLGQKEVLDEDKELGPDENEEGDDCCLSINRIVEAVVKGSDMMGLTNSESEMMVKSIAENPDESELERELELAETPMDTSDERGRGKRKREPNTLYARAFWRHYDEDTSDLDA
jgi:hypothetical protein